MKTCEVVCTTSDRAAWLAARNTGIGSSDAPVLILGKHFGRTPLMLWQEKIGMVESNDDPDLRFGEEMEPYILQKFTAATGRVVEAGCGLHRSTMWPFMLCTPDFIFNEAGSPAVPMPGDGYGECKTVGSFDGWPDGVPEPYWIQMQHGMAVTGLRRASIPVLGGTYGGFRFGYYDVDRDVEFIQDKLVPACQDFWISHVEPQVAPPAGPYDAGALTTQHPKAEPESVIHLDGSFTELDHDLVANMEMAKELKVRIDQAKNKIREAIGDAEVGRLGNGAEWRWSNTKKGRQLRRREAKHG